MKIEINAKLVNGGNTATNKPMSAIPTWHNFLPSSATDIQDPATIALLQQIERQIVQVPAQQDTIAPAQPSIEIATAYIHQRPDQGQTCSLDTPPILLLHGFDSSLLEFRRLLPFLSTVRETWAVDLFGSGFTDYVADLAVNPQMIRQHLYHFLKAQICQPVMLVGASLGGAVAIDFALHHPRWVRSIVLIDSVGFSGSFPVGQFLPHPLIDWGTNWLHFRKQAALAAASVLPTIDPLLVDALRCSLLHQEMPGWKAAIASFTRSGGYANLSRRITQVQHPTLILWGEMDDVLGTADAYKFEQAISDSQLRWIKQAGHVPHFDQPEQVAELIKAF